MQEVPKAEGGWSIGMIEFRGQVFTANFAEMIAYTFSLGFEVQAFFLGQIFISGADFWADAMDNRHD